MKKPHLAWLWACFMASCSSPGAPDTGRAECDAETMSLIGFEQLFSMYGEEVVEITLDQALEGYVISSDLEGNIFGGIYIQDRLVDPHFGLELKTDLLETHALFPPGSRVRLSLKGLFLGRQEAGFALGSMRDVFGHAALDRLPALATLEHLEWACEPGGEPRPRLVSVDSLRAEYVHTLVQLPDLEVSGSYPDSLFAQAQAETRVPLEDCSGNRIALVNSGYSDFQDRRLPSGSGTATGILLGAKGTFSLLIRRESDLDFENPSCAERFPPVRSDQVFISELADPDNAPEARFLELYNSGMDDVALRGWSLLRYTNDNTEPGPAADLSRLVIPAQSALVFSARPESFRAVYGKDPDVVLRLNGPADSNGDDTIVLMNPFGEVADLFGLPGEDGTGTAHEFEDGGAVRRPQVNRSNPVFHPDEWDVYNDTGGNGTQNLPRQAPGDFTPGTHHLLGGKGS